uniref:Uncharacterized protein n=1 Tax=Aegilops tauschii subsp. strangulata TaxID=200361 RepID=A0A453CQI3_AEGTS
MYKKLICICPETSFSRFQPANLMLIFHDPTNTGSFFVQLR